MVNAMSLASLAWASCPFLIAIFASRSSTRSHRFMTFWTASFDGAGAGVELDRRGGEEAAPGEWWIAKVGDPGIADRV